VRGVEIEAVEQRVRVVRGLLEMEAHGRLEAPKRAQSFHAVAVTESTMPGGPGGRREQVR
jgi:hypothetical protein